MTLFDQAVAATEKKDWKHAVKCYREFLVEHPRHEWGLNNLGYCIWQSGEPAEAVALLKRAISVNSKNAMAHANLVACLEASDQRIEAIPYRRRRPPSVLSGRECYEVPFTSDG